jgi:hypothetical protein
MFVDRDSTRLYAATWFGLFFSSDAGDTWERAAGVIGKLHVMAIGSAVVDGHTILYAATCGGDPGLESNSMIPATQTVSGPSGKSANTRNALLDKQVYLPLVLQIWPEPLDNLVEAGIYRFVQR